MIWLFVFFSRSKWLSTYQTDFNAIHWTCYNFRIRKRITLHTFNHVLDVWAHCADSGQFFFGSKPFFHLECAWRYHWNVQWQMFEITFQNTTRTFDCHNTWLHTGFNAPWNFHTLICVNGSHVCSAKKNENFNKIIPKTHQSIHLQWKFRVDCERIFQ